MSVVYEIMNELPFDNERKRMSLIVRERENNKITLLTKVGGDNRY